MKEIALALIKDMGNATAFAIIALCGASSVALIVRRHYRVEAQKEHDRHLEKMVELDKSQKVIEHKP